MSRKLVFVVALIILAETVFAVFAIRMLDTSRTIRNGDWVRYDFVVERASGMTTYPSWLKVEVLNIKRTNATVSITWHYPSGMERNQTMSMDLMV